MHIFSQQSRVPRRWARKLYLGGTSLILIGIVIEGLLIGPSLFSATRWGRAAHIGVGALLLLLALLLPLGARLAQLPGKMIIWSAVPFVLTLIQALSASEALSGNAPFLAALHVANALLLFGLTLVLLLQGWQLMREKRSEMKPS